MPAEVEPSRADSKWRPIHLPRESHMLSRLFTSRTKYRQAMAEALRLIDAWHAERGATR